MSHPSHVCLEMIKGETNLKNFYRCDDEMQKVEKQEGVIALN